MVRSFKLFLLACMLWPRCYGQGNDAVLRRIESEVKARLTYEILWGDLPEGFTPRRQVVRLGLYLTAESLYYCSHDLGSCALYRMRDRHIAQRVWSVRCNTQSVPAIETGMTVKP